MGDILKIGGGRVFTIKFRAGPTHKPFYHGRGMAGALSWGQGDVTKIEIPSDSQYNTWETIDNYQVSADRATTTLTVYEETTRSEIMDIIRARCAFDVQIHMGCDGDPRDFNAGYIKVRMLENAKGTSYDATDHGALEGGNQGMITEALALSADSIYDVLRMVYREVATAEVGEEVVAVSVCDSIACGECEGGATSDGCQRVMAVTNAGTASPGVKPQVIITTDQFGVASIIERWVTTFAIGENASDAVCAGANFVVFSSDGEALHYADIDDMVNEGETWTKVSTGFVAASGPTAAWNNSPLLTFVAGLGGYIYQVENPSDGATVLDAGIATTEDLNDIHGWDAENVTAVGDNGAIVYTLDGVNFSAMTAPSGPTNLEAVAYRKLNELWVGGDDGVLYYTTNYGTTWNSKTLTNAPSQIDKIVWLTASVGFVAGRTAAPNARVWRTLDGGYSWYVVPEASNSSFPTVDYINDMAFCDREANKLFLGGLADNGGDGTLIFGSDR